MTQAYSYIRFSTAEQAKGDSLRRQTELTDKFVKARGLILNETLTMRDLGVSAFKGANADEGALGLFLQAVDEGRVPTGSYLLVESLDRLSRAEVDVALQLFLRIIGKGIVIVTLADNREYSSASVKNNFTDLIVSIAVMARAHEESVMKSQRISKAWAAKREAAAKTGKVMSKVCPFWLKAKEDKSGFDVIEEYADIVRQMFSLALDGHGIGKIAANLNGRGITTSSGKPWKGPNIAKIMRQRAVIGEATFASFMNDDYARTPQEAIPNYYPSIVSEEIFYKVRDLYATKNFDMKTGKKSDNRNLFRRLVKCPYCGCTCSLFAMKYNTKKSGHQLYSTLFCTGKSSGTICPSSRWDYFEFQRAFLTHVRELDVSSLVGTELNNKRILELRELIAKERLSQEQTAKKLSNLLKVVEDGVEIDGLTMRLKELQQQINECEGNKKTLEAELKALEIEVRAAASNQNKMLELIDLLGDPDSSPKPYYLIEDDELARRSKLTSMIASMVERIDMFSSGMKLWPEMELSKNYRFMVVTFKSGLVRGISWNGNSLAYENGQWMIDNVAK